MAPLAGTFEVDKEATLGETGGVDDESDVGDAGVDSDCVTAERSAVSELCRRRC